MTVQWGEFCLSDPLRDVDRLFLRLIGGVFQSSITPKGIHQTAVLNLLLEH